MTTHPPAGGAEPSAPVPYGTPEAPRVAVRGEAHLERDPEIARIDITVGARGSSRRAALDDLTGRNAAVLDLVGEYGDAVERLETGAFSISPELSRHGRGERVRAYHGRVRIGAELADFTALGELVSRLADQDLTQVDGPWWALRPDSPVHREVRQQAVREAVQRAREYAQALGTELAALVEIADIGAEQPIAPGAPAGMHRRMPTSSFAGAPGGEAAPLDLQPQRQHVHAQVNARFTMIAPHL
ncbi:SIMPL domain-containing protein [Streptomyces sp. TS71-3]|uniref:SIMPL domain-containing protein n=1 Tax=Streptomyces sp. TS71-3 TaxID=2733862 RepID=UPI001BB3AC6E|nr:SIMPL domain-containing protein [Streptomyces sp. TS71-3]